MNAGVGGRRLSYVLDLLALIALAGTGEVRLEVFGLVAMMFALSRFSVRIPERHLVYVLLAIVVAALGVWFKFRFHPIVSAAYAAPLVHAISWFVTDSGRNRAWRLGIGFVELILSSALTAEAYLFMTIFAYVIFGAVAASCNYLDAELRARSPESANDSLPAGFMSRSLGLALVIFLCSAILFPILPRTRMDGGGGSLDYTKVGYTENVNLVENLRLNGAEGTGQAALWLYPRGEADLTVEIHMGLIRGKPLDVFDGRNWIASYRRSGPDGIQSLSPNELKNAVIVDAVRAPISTPALPVPYGTVSVFQGDESDPSLWPRARGGNWSDPASVRERTQYSFAMLPYTSLKEDRREVDSPIPANLGIPQALKSERMHRLSKSIFEGALSESEKVSRLHAYLQREGFAPSLGESQLPSLNRTAAAQKMHPIERFLFLTKEGHCEWFASASAILLRTAGVPTRLIAGFRMTKGQVGGVLTLTVNDAHAWVEYWQPSKGWVPFDPTPRISRPAHLMNVFRDSYEWVSGYWYRYVLGYQDGAGRKGVEELQERVIQGMDPSLKSWEREFRETLFENWEWVIGAMVAFVALTSLVYGLVRWRFPWLLSIRFRVREGAAPIRLRRIRMEKLLGRRLRLRNPSVEESLSRLRNEGSSVCTALESWQGEYLRLRFGPENYEKEALKKLDRFHSEVERTFGKTG